MPGFVIEILQNDNKSFPGKLISGFKDSIFKDKLNNLSGLLLLGLASILIAVITPIAGIKLSIAMAIAILGVPVLFAALFNIEFGIYLVLSLSFILLGIKKLTADAPLGLVTDIIIATLLFGMIIKQINERDWSFANNIVSKMFLVWIIYNLLQVVNPTAESRLAWLYTVRAMAGYIVIFYLALYALKNISFIKKFLSIWIIAATVAAFYGLFQEYAGFLPFEVDWIYSNEINYKLIYIGGRFRKFSFFSDPASFGLVMAYTGMLCYILMTGPFNKKIKFLFFTLGSIMMLAMLYSGTRSAFIIPVIGLLFYTIITFKKKVLIAAGIILFLGSIVMLKSTTDPNIYRLQSMFKISEDASFQTRIENQKFIQPYIQSHPFGGGLGSTGVWGKRFAPNSPLANFPPDGGYIRAAVELGWVGLLIYSTLLFIILYVGIKNYNRLKNPLLKNYSLALLSVLFSIIVVNYSNEVIIQIPTSLLFFVSVAIITKINKFDSKLVNKAK